jgi:hypothetical protein
MGVLQTLTPSLHLCRDHKLWREGDSAADRSALRAQRALPNLAVKLPRAATNISTEDAVQFSGTFNLQLTPPSRSVLENVSPVKAALPAATVTPAAGAGDPAELAADLEQPLLRHKRQRAC